MTHSTSVRTRLKQSARGELFNPLIYPFLISTFFYGVGFTVLSSTSAVAGSSLYMAMLSISPLLTFAWGVLAIVTIIVGFYVLVMDKPPIGKGNCLLAWCLWLFAGIVYAITGGWLPLLSVAVPNLYFWTWQYFSLARFRREDTLDNATMRRYDEGQYDDKLNPKQSKLDRENRPER